MTSIANRKKSIISTVGIEQPVANNTLLNKGASESLYQQCSRLRARLLRIPNFDRYFALATPASQSRQSTDPVTQLWDCLALGAPLCALYNMLPIQWMDPSLPVEGNPGPRQITVNYDPATFDASNEKDKKKAIMSFMIKAFDHFPECERFNLTEIAGSRESSDGFTKVVRLVSRILESLPDDVFSVDDQSDASTFAPSQSSDSLATNGTDTTLVNLTAKGRERINTLKEILMTERKYVQDLENMQRYAELAQGPLGGDVIHHLFPNLKQLLNFQRGFLIRFEGVAENPVNEQRWGVPFIEREPDFSVYEPYCANFNAALELSSSLQDALSVGPQASLIGFPELSAYLIKPIQRLCKYPLLLDQLIKTTEPDEYAYIDELKEGSAAAKRILDRINEAQRRADNVVAVENLRYRVEDWKGHALANFGELIRDDIFIVTKSDVDREYHVFLFQKIILCCKEVYQPPQSAKKVNKSNSILKKQQPPPTPSALPGGVGAPKKKNTPLLLKGRIFLTNVTQAIPSRTNGFSLAVWWNGEDDEYFTLRCRTEDQMTGWENAINKLIKETAERRASERLSDARARSVVGDSPLTRNSPNGYERGPSSSISGRSSMAGSAAGRARPTTPFGEDFRSSEGFPRNVGGGPNGYPSSDFFENDGDEYEDYPPALSAAPSGRGTPLGSRRSNGSRTPVGHNEESRSSSYSNNPPPMPPPVNGLPSGPAARGTFSRPSVSRVSSTLSGASSDGSFGPGAGRRSGSGLRNQMSSTRLNSQYDQQPDTRNTLPSQPAVPSSGLNRSRSQSQPSAYVPRQAQPPPPLPNMGRWDEQSPADGSKRGSGSSQSTGTQDSSDYSPEASSPATPYGGSDSSLGGGESNRGIRGTGKQHIIKVHFHEDIFMIQVSAQVEFADLVEKLGKKIRLCGTRRDDAPLRVKYRDEDGDLVSLGSTEDVQLAFETCQPGSSITLFVQ